ncbi:thioesterase II family protein [Actinosynnema sp.]|uniref:thioesterase II family protein n=1 Tax=Actinosynnema sp. TaxID=1872144 RepID=UPI003F85AFCE
MLPAHARSRWFASSDTPADPVCELLCFPHAGGGGATFHGWQRAATSVRVSAVLLPGRERRLDEPAIADLAELVDALVPVVGSRTHRRYALYGHSAGALIAFELARGLRASGFPPPALLVVAGCEAPQAVEFDRAHDLPRDELIAWLAATGGLDPEALAYPALVDLMLPSLRADLALAETYVHRPGPPLETPVLVLRGADDTQVTVEGSRGWSALTSRDCRVADFPGGHFFVQEHEADVLATVERALTGEGPR